jgi:hypothetical protein
VQRLVKHGGKGGFRVFSSQGERGFPDDLGPALLGLFLPGVFRFLSFPQLGVYLGSFPA